MAAVDAPVEWPRPLRNWCAARAQLCKDLLSRAVHEFLLRGARAAGSTAHVHAREILVCWSGRRDGHDGVRDTGKCASVLRHALGR